MLDARPNGHVCLFIGNYMHCQCGVLIVCDVLILSYAEEEIQSLSWPNNSELKIDHGIGQMSGQGKDFDELA